MQKDYTWNPAACSCYNSKSVESIVVDSVITCDEIMEETKTASINFNGKKVTCKKSIFYSLFYSLQ